MPVSLVIMDGKAVMVFDQGGRQKGSKAQKDYAKRWLDVFLAEPRKVMAVNADLLAACEAALDRLDSTLNEWDDIGTVRMYVRDMSIVADKLRAAIARSKGEG